MKKAIFQLALLITCLVSDLTAYQYQLSALAIFKNEADYLKEWIDYHLSIGVEHFILYNHRSDDNYKEILQPYIELGLVEVHDWFSYEFPEAQIMAYKNAITRTKNLTKWLAVIDLDEFIVPIVKDDIRDFLIDYEDYAGVVINWQLFGTSDIYCLPQGEWITKHLIYKFPTFFDDPTWNSNRFVKSIIRPDRVEEHSKNPNCGNHIFEPIGKYTLVNSDKIRHPLSCKAKNILVDKIQLNHYWFRTIDWFFKHKLSRRGLVGDTYSIEKIGYLFKEGKAEIDLQILRFVK